MYCERIAPGPWSEPANLASALAYLAAAGILGWLLAAQGRSVPASIRALPVLLGLVGVAGAGAHLVPVKTAGTAETVAVPAFALVALAVLARWSRPGWPDRLGRALAVAAGLFALSLVLRWLDRPLCGLVPTGTHALWHLLNAAAFFLVSYAAVRQWQVHARPAAEPRSPRWRGRRWRGFSATVCGALTLSAVALLPTAPPIEPRAGGVIKTGPASTVRVPVPLDEGWRFVRRDEPGAEAVDLDDAAWAPVSLPHTWNARDGQDGGNDYYRGAGWYRRHFTPRPSWTGRRFWLEFDGANAVTDVWVNGTHLGQHRGGYARFRFDATPALRPGRDNVIAVRVSNAPDPAVPPLGADYTFFGGLYRHVRLLVTDPLSVDLLDDGGPGVYVRAPSSSSVEVTTKVRNSGPQRRTVTVDTTVAGEDGQTVAYTTSTVRHLDPGQAVPVLQPIAIPAPRPWRGRADPYLYRVVVEVRDAATRTVIDRVTERFGLRDIAIDPDRGLFLNGAHLAVHGVSRHQDVQDAGWAISDADQRRDFDLMDEMGVNALRTAHYQQDQGVYDLADERGYLVWTEIPLVNGVTDSRAFTANAEQQLRELIRQNFNHPSIAFWGIGNEQDKDDAATNRLLDTLARLVTTEDPGRRSAYAHATAVTTGGLTERAAVTGYNRYYGWYYGTTDQLGPFLDALHKAQPNRCIALSEYGAGGGVRQHQADPPRPEAAGPWHPEEYQALYHERYWAQISARPYLWGSFVWNMFDFAADQRGEGDTPGRNDKGLVTYDRQTRKDAFYWYKANWTDTPFVHLTSARWTDRTAPVTSVKVYGTADRVRLLVNGVQIGPPVALTGHVHTWPNVVLAPGANTVEVTGDAGSDTATWTLRAPPPGR